MESGGTKGADRKSSPVSNSKLTGRKEVTRDSGEVGYTRCRRPAPGISARSLSRVLTDSPALMSSID